MDYPITLLALLSALLVVFLSAIYWRVRKAYDFFAKREIPGPYPVFPLGTWNYPARKFIGTEDIKNVEKFGDIIGTFDGLTPNLLVTDKELIQRILTTDRSKFSSRRAQNTKSITLKKVLQILDDEQPKEVGALLGNISKILDKLLPKIEQSAKLLVGALPDGDEKPISVNSAADYYIDTVVATVILGLDLNENPIFRQRFVKHSRNIHAGTSSSSALAALPILYGGSENSTLAVSTLEYFKSIIATRVNEAMNNEQDTEEKLKSESCLIDALVAQAKEERNAALKEKAQESGEESTVEDSLVLNAGLLVQLTLATLVALIHFSKSTLIFSWNALSNDKTVFEKITNEVKKSADHKNMTVELMKKLPYLNAFVLEVSRKYPTEFRLEKISESELELPKGAILPAKTAVTIPVYALHSSEKFHKEAELFNPERFLSESYEKLNPVFHLPNGWALPRAVCDLTTKIALLKVTSALELSSSDGGSVYADGLTGLPKPREIFVVVSTNNSK